MQPARRHALAQATTDAGGNLEPGDEGAQHGRLVGLPRLPERQNGGPHRSAGVSDGRNEGVVEVEAVR